MNAWNSCPGERRQSKEPMLIFMRISAVKMVKNVLDDIFIPKQPLRGPITRGVSSLSAEKGIHNLETQPHSTSDWLGSTWKKVKDKY